MARSKRMAARGKDNRVFKATYNKTKRVNRAQATANGGIRF